MRITQETINLDQPYITLDKKHNTYFNKMASSININFEHPSGKDPGRKRKDVDKGTYSRYDIYTPLNNSLKIIYQECANADFIKL